MLAPVLLGIIHAIVDASTVSAVMRATHLNDVSPQLAFAMVVGYDVIAFGSQVFFGWLTDRFLNPRIALAAGLVLTALGLVSSPLNNTATVALAGIGNALFHLGGGALVLGSGLTRAAPQGVFVAPGALGLAFGLFYGSAPARGPLWPLLALTVVALVAFLAWRQFGTIPAQKPRQLAVVNPAVARHAYWIVALLLASITVRSLVGLSAARGYSRTGLLIIGLPIAAFLGKSLGGFLADRLGWLETSVAALLLSLPFITLAPPTLWLLFGLFAFQMTMPVTLTAVAQLMPNHLATA
ncbi:MAG TPA: MFS transporter, partial [Polyangiaceae bacterium]|nr:MFS transporter [Polyangiaceae bacterium]